MADGRRRDLPTEWLPDNDRSKQAAALSGAFAPRKIKKKVCGGVYKYAAPKEFDRCGPITPGACSANATAGSSAPDCPGTYSRTQVSFRLGPRDQSFVFVAGDCVVEIAQVLQILNS